MAVLSQFSRSTLQAVLLITSMPKDLATEGLQRKVQDVLSSKGVLVSTVDGAVAQNKDERSAMFELSGKRAVYPQLFKQNVADGSRTFVADGEGFMHMLELNDHDHAFDALLAELVKK